MKGETIMKWLIENNLHNELNYDKIIDQLREREIDYQIVGVIPLTNIIIDVNDVGVEF